MRIRIIIPPNLETCASRDAIPVKLEFEQDSGKIATPESLALEALAGLDEKGRIAAYSLLQWGGGSLRSLLQLSGEQFRQLVACLEGEPCFYWANQPKAAIAWNTSELIGVSKLLGDASAAAQPAIAAERPAPATSAESDQEALNRYEGTPMLVDGSTHFLAISLPSREHPFYAEIRELLSKYDFKLEPRNRRWWLRDRHQTLNFLGEQWEHLEFRYGAEFTDNFRSRTASIMEVEARTEVVEERNGYQLALTLRAGDLDEQTINHDLNKGKRYLESGDKVFLVKQGCLDTLRELQRTLSASPNAPLLYNGRYAIPYNRAPEVEETIAALNPNFSPPSTWRARSAALKDLSRLKPVLLPESLESILRPYQKIGVYWMRHLYDYDLGGILADEMGLGKTLQALAMLASLNAAPSESSKTRSQAIHKPSLVVCPASLVENWRREAKRFCPELSVFVNQGSQRLSENSSLDAIDIIVTSYGTLIRDQERFAAIDFNCVIGDEAQHIKNRRTRNAKALASLKTEGRFLLTGTPVENSIQDLMSLLDFIMPGGWKGIPQNARGEERQWHEQRIKEQAGPYILRRSKESVAPELPEKLEQVLYIEMTGEQKRAYEAAKRSAESEIANLEQSGANEGAIRMKTLTQLLRLRQTCCDPRLADASLQASHSAKLSSFMELLQEAMDDGHRVLVFSQFVAILSFLREELEQEGLDYCYLDGSTRDRMAQVDRFQNDPSVPLFLISLKAGGTGLNLTAADTVIHFDPWWNPAAEAQATDRAHRIGQSKVVTSYKLIITDSVEEKVLQMQQQKRQLLADVFDASEAANAKLTLQDFKELL